MAIIFSCGSCSSRVVSFYVFCFILNSTAFFSPRLFRFGLVSCIGSGNPILSQSDPTRGSERVGLTLNDLLQVGLTLNVSVSGLVLTFSGRFWVTRIFKRKYEYFLKDKGYIFVC